MKKNMTLLGTLLLLFGVAGTAFAGPMGNTSAPSNLTIDDLHLAFLQTILDWLSDPKTFVVDRMLSMGQELFWVITLLYFSFMGLKLVLDSSSVMEQIGSLINALIPWGLIKFALDYYATPLPGTDKSLIETLDYGFKQVSANMLGLDVNTSVTNGVYAGMEAYMKIALMLWQSFPIGGYQGDSVFSKLTGFIEALSQYQVLIADFIIMCVAMLALVACAALFIAIYAYAMMMFAVGMIVGPILLPWRMLPPLSYLTDGWLKYMVLSGMFRVVALAIIHINELIALGIANTMDTHYALTSNIANGMSNGTLPINLSNTAILAINIATSPIQHLILSMAMLIVALLTLYMLTKVDSVTGSLLSGTGSGGLSFGKGGMQTAFGGGGHGGGAGGAGAGGGSNGGTGIGGSGGGNAIVGAAKAALSGGASAAATAAGSTAASRLSSYAGGKAFDKLPSGAQGAIAAGGVAASNAVSRANTAMQSAGNAISGTPKGQQINAVTRAANTSKPTQAPTSASKE